MATLKKQGKTGRRKGTTKATRPKDRQTEGAQAEEESAASDETEVVDDDDDDDESDPLVGGVAGALIGGVAGLVIGGVLGAMAEAFKSAVDDDDEDEEADEDADWNVLCVPNPSVSKHDR